MGKDASTGKPAPTREERLAAKLRENLHRRKAQARAHQAGPGEDETNRALPKSLPTG